MGPQPGIGAVRTGCLCCPPRPGVADLDMYPHPGFGLLELTRNGEPPEWWDEFCGAARMVYEHGKWETGARRDGTTYEWYTGGEFIVWPAERLTLRDVEECCAEDPDNDWRLRIEGPLGGVVYQRHGCAQWVAIERLDGFA